MPRTTLNIDAPVLRQVKKLQKQKGRSLGRVVSDLLAAAISTEETREEARPGFRWISRPMGAKVDLADKEAVRSAVESEWPVSEVSEGREP